MEGKSLRKYFDDLVYTSVKWTSSKKYPIRRRSQPISYDSV